MSVVFIYFDVIGFWKINEGESDVIVNLVIDENIYLLRFLW